MIKWLNKFFRHTQVETPQPRCLTLVDSIRQSVRTIDKLASKVYAETGTSPEWKMLVHASFYLKCEEESTFRKMIGR